MTKRARRVTYLCAAFLVLGTAMSATAQTRYARGQNIAPVFEGWERNPDGTFSMNFGYMNRNWEEELEVPLGPNNTFEPGPADRGQPSHFYTRRQAFVFKVQVPKDWGQRDLVWTLTAHGRTDRAYGTLLPEWEINNTVFAENRGGGAAIDYNNQPPSLTVGPVRSITPNSVTLTATISDDGLPKPRRPSPAAQQRRPQGLRLSWIHYRGPGKVTFDPADPQFKTGEIITTASFSGPGTYVLRAIADDGGLFAVQDVTVTISPPSAVSR